MRALFYDRAFVPALGLDGLFSVQDLSWGLPGGAKTAVLEMESDHLESEMERVLGMLRFGVDICDDLGQVVWNGFVNEVEIWRGAVSLKLGLDGLANRVAVRYEDLKPRASWSKEDSISDFVEDSNSILDFGVKEWIGNLPNATPAQAAAAATTWLKEKVKIRKNVELIGNKNEKVVLHCVGWWESLGWIFYEQEAGFLGFLKEGKRERNFGNSSSTVKVAQKFIAPVVGFKVDEVWVRIAKTGEPLDNVIVEVVADSSANPGTGVLTSGLVAGSELTGGYNWVRFEMSNPNLTGGAGYWIVVRRSGAVEGINYYSVQVDDGMGFGDGDVKTWNGSVWTRQLEDLNFAMLGAEETTMQIERMAGVGGQFLNGVRILNESGVNSLLWRELRLSCKEEIEGMLAVGNLEGKKLDAMVDGQRNLVVWERKEEPEWKLDGDGKLWTLAGAKWNPGMDWLGGVAVTELGERVEIRGLGLLYNKNITQ
ncbi:MAG: choice-of-anchor R domain-containing protein [Anaerolineaceae bacterium]